MVVARTPQGFGPQLFLCNYCKLPMSACSVRHMKRILTAAIVPLVLAGCATAPDAAPPEPAFTVATAIEEPTIPRNSATQEQVDECMGLVAAEYPPDEQVNAVITEASDYGGQAIIIGETRTARLGTMMFACQTMFDDPIELAFHGAPDEW